MRRFLPFAALLGVAFVLGCQDLGTGVVASDGLVPQFSKKDCGADSSHPGCKGEADGGGHHFVFVDVKLTGWMITTPVDDRNQMELARKPGIMKIRANNEKAGTKFLHFAIDMDNTLNTLTASVAAFNNNCEWSGRVEQTPENEMWVVNVLLPLILNDPLKERSVLVVIDESAFVEDPVGTFVSVSDDNRMNIWPGFFVRGSPTVTVVDGDPAGDDFKATFSGGKVELAGVPPGERNQIHLSCNIFDVITFTVVGRG